MLLWFIIVGGIVVIVLLLDLFHWFWALKVGMGLKGEKENPGNVNSVSHRDKHKLYLFQIIIVVIIIIIVIYLLHFIVVCCIHFKDLPATLSN